MMEALACHPLDTIKVRMQLSKRSQRGVSLPSPLSLSHFALETPI